MPPKASALASTGAASAATRTASQSASPHNLSVTANTNATNTNTNTAANKKATAGVGARGELGRGISGRLGNSYNNNILDSDHHHQTAEQEAAHEAQQQEFSRQRQSVEHDESLHRQRHEALQAVSLKIIQIEYSKQKDPLAYFKLTKPSTSDDVSRHQIVVKLMTCNRAMKPFSIAVALPKSDGELSSLSLGSLKELVFEAAKSNFVDPIMLPLLQPHMIVLYNNAGKQIGRVEDKEAMDRWIAAHPPPTKKLSVAERAALPAPPPMPTVESDAATVKEFGVVPGATIYVAVRVAAQEVVGSDAHEGVSANRPQIIPPVNPKDLKSNNSHGGSGSGNSSSKKKPPSSATGNSNNNNNGSAGAQPTGSAGGNKNDLSGTSPARKR